MHVRAALYARVSTEDQAREGFSLDAQLGKLRAYCRARGWEVAGEYVDDGYSGRDERRPAYQRMLEERDAWETILVMKMDRIHRNSKHFMAMMDRLRTWDKEFTSMQESLDTGTAMGRFVMDIIQRIAQLESEQIAERVYAGMEQKAKAGEGSLGGVAPYGYRYEDGVLVPVPEEAVLVREAFRRAARREPLQWIVDALNARRGDGGRTWSLWSLRYLLRNPAYAGHLRWDGHLTRGDHEPLVPAEEALSVLREFHRRARSEEERRRLEEQMAVLEEGGASPSVGGEAARAM